MKFRTSLLVQFKVVQTAHNSSPGQKHPPCITVIQLAEAVKYTFKCKINDRMLKALYYLHMAVLKIGNSRL